MEDYYLEWCRNVEGKILSSKNGNKEFLEE